MAYSDVESFCLRSATVVERDKVRTYLASDDDLTLNVICGSLSSAVDAVLESAMTAGAEVNGRALEVWMKSMRSGVTD